MTTDAPPAPPTPPAAPPEPPAAPPPPADHWSVGAGISEDYLKHPAVTESKSGDDFVKTYLHAQSKIGEKGILPLGENPSDEDQALFYKSIGRPEDAADYDIENMETPEGFQWDMDLRNQLIGELHGAGLTKSQAQRVTKAYVTLQHERQTGETNKIHDLHQEEASKLKLEWGLAFDKNIEVVGHGFRYIFGDPKTDQSAMDISNLQLRDGRLLGDHPSFVRGLYKIGGLVGEPDPMTGDSLTTPGILNAQGAKDEIERLDRDESFTKAYYNRDHAEHNEAVKKYDHLHQMAYPPEGT